MSKDINPFVQFIQAAKDGHVENLSRIFRNNLGNLNPNDYDSDGMTALMWAVANGHPLMVQYLAIGVDTSLKATEGLYAGQTALEIAQSRIKELGTIIPQNTQEFICYNNIIAFLLIASFGATALRAGNPAPFGLTAQKSTLG